ncbi:type II toxin-antitoxin system RelE/ParE family toxin [Corynebacterium kalinowskii]|uniref:type II toxin-antitoxin system RelE/ParE family toxin n=1 Tax=Corynebacterium kalinowskii TaxID=2675216 RepID=UPI0012E195A9|nr:type II toxin-antitoxin system mRNA interferase toxin, RelE/StbE family [Corynebacterium kalinowskii]
MIVSFKHRGLESFFRTGSRKGIQTEHARKLSRILSVLDVAESIDPLLSIPGYRTHALTGNRSGFWSLKVSGNWRVVFRFVGTDVELVDYLDYH